MLSNEKALYQVKLILDYLPEDEYDLIPEETIDYIENNFEYDENIVINPEIPLENQNIDEKTYEILDKIVKQAENVKSKKSQNANSEIKELVDKAKKENEEFDIKIENIRLSKLVETLKKENAKIPKIKDLVVDYKEALEQKDNEIIKLKQNNQILYTALRKIPKFIRRIFIKTDEIKMLESGK